ncbi:dolichyl-diphosphooligosaccharide--protein glycosyltransferase subunit 2-like [Plasmopara halstedii]|uniref:Ribophorin II n=1 Tax=Plasmopara halstedii TaxID=4781 RepID=A0A0P1AD20_PLAHL|nr:dolichyl-diphosphooligosaccharide--protein glycosyltransferase subunit 2-like [Plasmopara halstedii]CEG38250.1 dolichyl-diphosphooligosaccharide--protein glycosyltransferase subunit 2-like [Plasmopara halstedii]|eukprot:XP_024574619.1 dolichyl-diphosphooligosaccharide--protein glycosyltransferase subunit 2-like [Plasmopara halstedii]
MKSLAWLHVTWGGFLLLLSLSADAAFNVNMKLESTRVPLKDDALELAVVVTPKQPKLKQLTLETLVDTTGAVVLSEIRLEGDGSRFAAKLTGDQMLQAGMYKLKVTAVNEATKESSFEVLPLKITTAVEVMSAKANGKKMKFGDKLTGMSFIAAAEDTLKLEVRLQQVHNKAPVVAHQAFLHFTHITEKTEAYFVLTADTKSIHSTTLQFAALSKKFGYNSGTYHVELILGSATFEKALLWDLGDVELHLVAAPPETPSPLYKKPLLHESDTTLKALPVIQHVMRQEDPRPPVVVSMAFLGAVLTPLGLFVVFVARLGLNVKRLFEGPVFAFGCVFLASLAGIFTLFGLYWLELTMFRTLSYLSILGSVNFWSGHLTLKRLAATPGKKKSKAE